jgi:hypothetical protein
MMARYCAGSHGFDVVFVQGRAGHVERSAAQYGRNENRMSVAKKFDTGGLSLHVFSIP